MSPKIKAVLFPTSIIIYSVIYYVMCSYNDFYSGQPSFLPFPTYYPIGILLGVILLLLFNVFIIKQNKKYVLQAVVGLVVCLIVLTSVVNDYFGTIFSHYYMNYTHSGNISGIFQYSKQKGNYFTIREKIFHEGIYADFIDEDYIDEGAQLKDRYKKPLAYRINEDVFIIFDWNNESIIKIANCEEISIKAFDYLKVNAHLKDEYSEKEMMYGCSIEYIVSKRPYTVFVYAENEDFAFRLNK